MEAIYECMESVLPFSFMHYDFMKNALLAVLLLTPIFGMIGTMVVDHKLAFFSDALGHSALTGIAIGVLLGISVPVVAYRVRHSLKQSPPFPGLFQRHGHQRLFLHGGGPWSGASLFWRWIFQVLLLSDR